MIKHEKCDFNYLHNSWLLNYQKKSKESQLGTILENNCDKCHSRFNKRASETLQSRQAKSPQIVKPRKSGRNLPRAISRIFR